jgi:hypothetical protein
MYKLESELVDAIADNLKLAKKPFSYLDIAFEFNYKNGITDIVATNNDGCLFAFEAKLKRWKIALFQAYRNSSFAHYSYVILPRSQAKHAIKSSHEFEKRGVGLCSFGESSIMIEIPAKKNNPIQPWLTESAKKHTGRNVFESTKPS